MPDDRTQQKKIKASDITGLKYFDQLAPLLARLHDDGCERDRAASRTLHYDQYCMLLLLYRFNPVVTSLRGIQQASELQKVQRQLGCARASLGSLSEATSVFEAERLKEITAELGEQLQPLALDRRLVDIPQTITLVVGSVMAALPKIMEASWRKADCGSGLVKWRLHMHFELLRGVPTRIDVTPNGGGVYDERAVLQATIESDRLYVGDRGYTKFALFNQIVPADSSYVCRLRDNSAWETRHESSRLPTDSHRGPGRSSPTTTGSTVAPDQRVWTGCASSCPEPPATTSGRMLSMKALPASPCAKSCVNTSGAPFCG